MMEECSIIGMDKDLWELDFDHLDLGPVGVLCEELRVEDSRAARVSFSAGEVAGAHVPHDVRAEQVELRDASLARIVVET